MADESDLTVAVADVKPGKYETCLAEMRERWDYATAALDDIRKEARYDMQCRAGDPWDPVDRRKREQAGRPVLSLDELAQYCNQAANDVRQHKRAIQVTPLGNGAHDQEAEFRQNLIRQIEYRSKAQTAYTTMFDNVVDRSYGFFRILPRYCVSPKASGGSGEAFNQDLWIEAIPNPDLVTYDPDILSPTGADMKYAWIAEAWDLKDYRKRFPKARVRDFSAELAKQAPTWLDARRIRIAEYYTIEHQPDTLYLYKNQVENPDGSRSHLEVFEDDLKDERYQHLGDLDPDAEREVDRPIVMKYLTNGFEVLETPTRWPGSTIPLVCCFGKILYVDDGGGAKKTILSLIRLARDPYLLYCYYRTCEAELVGMTPKTPYFVRRGSLSEEEKINLQRSLHEPVGLIEVNGVSDAMPPGQSPEFPQRNPYEPVIQALEIGAEGARRAIQAAMGISPLPTNTQRLNAKSGKALEEIRDSEQIGSFHLVDNYEAAIARGGQILNEVLPVYYDSARTIHVRTPGDEPQQVRINDPDPSTYPAGQTEPMLVGEGEYDVTLSTGPSFDSERDASNEFADTMADMVPNLLPIVGPQKAAQLLALSVKLKNLGPTGDEIVELLTPPPPGQITPEMAQQLQAENQALKQQLGTKIGEIQAKGAIDLKKTAMQETSAQQIASERNRVDLLKTEITAAASMSKAQAQVDAENFRSWADALESRAAKDADFKFKVTQLLTEHNAAAREANAQRTHDTMTQALEHAHEHAMADKQARIASVQSAQDASQTADLASQTADSPSTT